MRIGLHVNQTYLLILPDFNEAWI